MRCPRCDATNPDTATFCGQCYDRFETPDPDPAPADATTTGDEGGAQFRTPVDDTAVVPPRAHSGGGEVVAVGRFTLTGEGLTWRCAFCDTSHPAGEFVCTVCGAKMDDEAGATATAAVDWDRARRLELLAPGLGHLRAGQGGMGAARGGILIVWLLGTVLLVTGGLSGLLTAVPLLLGIAVVWATGPGDLDAARRGVTPRLDARRFMYLVIGVTTAVIIMGGLAVIL